MNIMNILFLLLGSYDIGNLCANDENVLRMWYQ